MAKTNAKTPRFHRNVNKPFLKNVAKNFPKSPNLVTLTTTATALFRFHHFKTFSKKLFKNYEKDKKDYFKTIGSSNFTKILKIFKLPVT